MPGGNPVHLARISAASIDRILRGFKVASGEKVRPHKHASSVKDLVEVRAESRDTTGTGWTEVDTVAHCGGDWGGDLCQEERRKLEARLATLNPFALRKEIRRLEDRVWSRREELCEKEREEERLALAGAAPLRFEAPASGCNPTTGNQAAIVSYLSGIASGRSGTFRFARFVRQQAGASFHRSHE